LAKKKITSIYVVGSSGLTNDLVAYGAKAEYSANVSAVVVGLDTSITYEKIAMALQAIKNGAQLIAANADPYYPAADGQLLPGCGAMVGAIVGASGHQPDFCVGKPNTFMLELICKEHGLTPAEICVVGDMPESDIAIANNFGCRSVLFDPGDAYKTFLGIRVKNLRDIVALLEKRREE
jgi:HAD superfamily hydrolase (TIGR01450 family)